MILRVTKSPEVLLPIVAEPAYTEVVPLQQTPFLDNSSLPVSNELITDLQLAECLWRSGFFSSISSRDQAISKMQMGREIGIGPVTALRELYVIQGRLAMSSTLMGALIQKSGIYDYRVTKLDNQIAVIHFFKHGEFIGESSFSIDDAIKASIAGKDNWKKWPKAMLFARAISAGSRYYCPEIFLGGAYSPEELGDDG